MKNYIKIQTQAYESTRLSRSVVEYIDDLVNKENFPFITFHLKVIGRE